MQCRDGTGKMHKSKRNFSKRGITLESKSRKALYLHKGKTYQCELCDNSFPNCKSMLKHMRVNHGSIKEMMHKCEFCGKHFLTDKHLKQHSLVHQDEEDKLGSANNVEQLTEINLSEDDDDASGQNDSCYDDDTETALTSKAKVEDTNISELQTNDGSDQKNVHTGDIFCQCYDCEIDFNTFKSKTNVLLPKQTTKPCETNTRSRPTCEICKKTFHRNRALEKHMENIHGGKKDVCKICCKAFNSDYFQTHMATQHADSSVIKKVFKCSKCDKTFLWKHSLQKHVINHHNTAGRLLKPRFPCDACEKQFSCTKNLSRHKKIKHTMNQEKLICAHCDSQFLHRTSITSHMVLMHLPPTIKCKMCSLLFRNSTELNRHLLAQHSIGKVKSFVCELCGKTFKAKHRYDYHMTTSHSTEEKRFKCQHCEKSFHVKHLLQQHSLVHSEARTFNCGLCDKAFKLKHHLRQHMAVHGLDSTPDYSKKQNSCVRDSKVCK